jgi:hypothetical protein
MPGITPRQRPPSVHLRSPTIVREIGNFDAGGGESAKCRTLPDHAGSLSAIVVQLLRNSLRMYIIYDQDGECAEGDLWQLVPRLS